MRSMSVLNSASSICEHGANRNPSRGNTEAGWLAGWCYTGLPQFTFPCFIVGSIYRASHSGGQTACWDERHATLEKKAGEYVARRRNHINTKEGRKEGRSAILCVFKPPIQSIPDAGHTSHSITPSRSALQAAPHNASSLHSLQGKIFDDAVDSHQTTS